MTLVIYSFTPHLVYANISVVSTKCRGFTYYCGMNLVSKQTAQFNVEVEYNPAYEIFFTLFSGKCAVVSYIQAPHAVYYVPLICRIYFHLDPSPELFKTNVTIHYSGCPFHMYVYNHIFIDVNNSTGHAITIDNCTDSPWSLFYDTQAEFLGVLGLSNTYFIITIIISISEKAEELYLKFNASSSCLPQTHSWAYKYTFEVGQYLTLACFPNIESLVEYFYRFYFHYYNCYEQNGTTVIIWYNYDYFQMCRAYGIFYSRVILTKNWKYNDTNFSYKISRMPYRH